MRIKGTWTFAGESIPGHWIADAESDDDLRFVASDYGYRKLRRAKCDAAGRRCSLQLTGCRIQTALSVGELHHTGAHGRGAGGSRRDDRKTVWTCRPCHDKTERQRTGTRWSQVERIAQ